MKNKYIYLLIISLSCTVVYGQFENTKAAFVYEENLIIGNDQNADVEYIFGLPSAVLSGKDGEIYISDDKYGAIRIYDRNGRFLREFGGPGRGPGEFSEVTSMTLFPNGDLLIYDLKQFRFTRFDKRGKVVAVYLAPKNFTMHPDYMRIMGEDIVLFARDYKSKYSKEPQEDFLIHVVSKDFSEVKSEFVPVSHTIDVDDAFEYRLEGGVYRGLFTNSEKILTLAPFFYRGKIYQYEKNEESSQWAISDTMYSYIEMDKPYKKYDDPEDVIGKGIIASSPNGPLSGIMNNESLALFRKSDGSLLHLALIRIDGKQELYASHFNRDGELLAHGQVENLSPGLQENGFYRRMRFYWMDEKDQIYFLDQAADGMTVRRGYIKVKK